MEKKKKKDIFSILTIFFLCFIIPYKFKAYKFIKESNGLRRNLIYWFAERK